MQVEHYFNAIITSPIGKLGIKTSDSAVVAVAFLNEKSAIVSPNTKLAKETVRQLQAYFSGKLTHFDLPLEVDASSFQKTVYDQVNKIPFGATRTYGEIAHRISSGPRAVGSACRCNQVPIIIPCHRVVAKNHLGGYAGARTGTIFAIKQWLLDHEKAFVAVDKNGP